jgi:4-hydroxybenzoate polyprenyltransferase
MAMGFLLADVAGAAGWAAGYLALSGAYSTHLKRLPLVDVFVLAALYTLRVVAGGAASGYEVSRWLLAFSGFVFLALGTMKRVAELRARVSDGETVNRRRAYGPADVGFLEMFGVAASMTSAVVMALYVQSQIGPGSAVRFPVLLLGVVPAVLLWQARLWLATWRGYMFEDPITYAARDRVTRIAALLIGACFVLSAWAPW